ncbi:hypothetical protein EJ05DRAFT_477069 [Pseudovirgaria hyperparasitica]|uniref:Uncharacterized protein n=1 Tax=Pseudovirgaria hyperparasitica TaxID=470096 RepID=A0A6A6W3V5_9PEZI|nr:uncharacterized protein EJ05DRAFT_477069 [Pseudovirgaria hyperparasitica]KAF2756839.1 hypothetical protein EJ05DRAFT_477069 [Pseudovirgaria hyperparasitica]
MASIRTDSVSPFSIYEEHNRFDQAAGTGMSVNDSTVPNYDCDVPLASIENDAPLSHVGHTSKDKKKKRLSNATVSSVSSFPSEITSEELDQDLHATLKQYTPMRSRPAFRNTSSVKAMQMSSPLPSLPSSPPHMQQPHHLATPIRRSETPRSQRSQSIRSDRQLERRYESAHQTPVYETPKRDYPLVLLHVTLLPPSLPYSAHILESVLPGWLLENFRLLENRLEDSTLMGRGLLIPHPRHEYELLEERLLESLDLAPPRLLKSGHFNRHRSSSCASSISYDPFEDDDDGCATARGSNSGSDMEEDLDDDVCPDCSQPMGSPSKGAGIGKRRWDVRIYAANGLMRSGAWSAAWMEMERVDVEVLPWIPEDLKKKLEREMKSEENRRGLQKEIGTSIRHGIPTPPASEGAHSRQQSDVAMDASQILREPQVPSSAPKTVSFDTDRPALPRKCSNKEVPLAAALLNYFYLLAQDTRNLMVIGLSLVVLFLCIRPSPAPVFDRGLPSMRHFTSSIENAIPVTETVIALETVTATETVSQTVVQTLFTAKEVPPLATGISDAVIEKVVSTVTDTAVSTFREALPAATDVLEIPVRRNISLETPVRRNISVEPLDSRMGNTKSSPSFETEKSEEGAATSIHMNQFCKADQGPVRHINNLKLGRCDA